MLIDIQDHCGGLGVGNKEDMFQPFRKVGTEKAGIGLGLAISRRSVEANKGVLSVRDIPGSGCVFTITLPKVELPKESATLDILRSVRGWLIRGHQEA